MQIEREVDGTCIWWVPCQQGLLFIWRMTAESDTVSKELKSKSPRLFPSLWKHQMAGEWQPLTGFVLFFLELNYPQWKEEEKAHHGSLQIRAVSHLVFFWPAVIFLLSVACCGGGTCLCTCPKHYSKINGKNPSADNQSASTVVFKGLSWNFGLGFSRCFPKCTHGEIPALKHVQFE